MQAMKVAVIPGNGSGSIQQCNWYGWLQRKLHQPPAVSCVLRNMPDPVRAREKVWLPFMESELGVGEDTIIVGHSSGAAAAMRYAETHRVAGLVLVSAYTTDQGDPLEAASGYFSRPWQWDAIRSNAGFVEVFASHDDPFLPWSEQEEVAQSLGAVLHEYYDAGHFQMSACPDLLAAVEARLRMLLRSQPEQSEGHSRMPAGASTPTQ